MATNFSKFKENLEKSRAKKASTASNWFKAEAGHRYQLRFLPLKNENLELPVTIYEHHALNFPNGTFESIACPKKSGADCPFCDLAWKTYRTFTKTEDKAYKDAFSKLVAKTHFLMVAYEADKVDVNNITEADLKIVRASSKTNMELIESKLEKGVDFCDFKDGRIVEYLKSKATTKGGFDTIVLDFGDKSVAFEDLDMKTAKKAWDLLVEKSPDLTNVVTPLSPEALQAKFKEFSATPVVEEHEEQDRGLLQQVKNDHMKRKTPVAIEVDNDDGDIDLDALRAELS